ncbi:MAG: maltooligosyl trehalose synthase [Devosia sp.]|jgi:(1->4)-alpha-D-glucan 1-alpha-D-glucosylmutase|nr:maltooligosyl trehalose synthase [Devosia sp.]
MSDSSTTPLSTYRLQLNKGFTFAHAKALVPYLADLGVSHAYLSPILKAQPGSTHGYDTVDHTLINPEIGTIEEFRDLAQALRAAGLGILLDFVPNHMGVGGADNPLWLDVLRHGPGSQYADWFDINWAPANPALEGKLMIPFLGTSYAQALEAGEIVLKADSDGLAVWAHGTHKLPLRPEDEEQLLAHYGDPEAAVAALNGEPGHFGSWAALDSIIATQHWRLSHYLAAADDINYRRFFINSDLGAIRIDRPDVFQHAHALIFGLIAEGLVDGLRIDHVDGLLDPKGYLEDLRAASPRPIYLLIEKILAPHEDLRADWPVEGTTGYEFGALLTRVLTNPAAEAPLSATYERFVGAVVDPVTEAYQCKLRVMDNELAAELFSLAHRVFLVAQSVPQTRDLTQNAIRKGLREIIAWLQVYRTYIDGPEADERDKREIHYALAKARRSQPFFAPALFDFLGQFLTAELPHQYDPSETLAALGKFQQYTGPVMAKGLEDTALYRFNRLVSLNEVGAHPQNFSVGIDAFHDANRRRLSHHRATMLTTSTHDTKRGEDTRANIGAIADHPEIWDGAVSGWRDQLAGSTEPAIDNNDIYLFLQLLLGGWPPGDSTDDPSLATLTERLQAAMLKSVREARLHSDWSVNNPAYEQAIEAFVAKALRNEAFLSSFRGVQQQLADTGRRKSLIQAALKLTVPGVPDIYRGAEDWEQSFVDPDNRRDLNFAGLRERLTQARAGSGSAADDKMVLTTALLQLRRAHPELLLAGAYEPIATGSEQVLGFARASGNERLIVLADLSPGHTGQAAAAVALPAGQYRDVMTGETVAGQAGAAASLSRHGFVVLLSA